MRILIPAGVLVISFLITLEIFHWRNERKLRAEARARWTANRALADQLDRWNALNPDVPFHEHMGMTEDQCAEWLTDGRLLK